MLTRIALIFMSSFFLVACQTPPDIQQLQTKNSTLQTQLEAADRRVAALRAQEMKLNNDIKELNRIIDVLGAEKSSRTQESSVLRGQVRTFVQDQIDLLRAFLVQGNLLDYIGGELVERRYVDDGPLVLVDLANPIPQNGTLTGVGSHVLKPATIAVKVLRPVDDKYVVIWESDSITVQDTGLNRINFPVSVGVEKGDIAAYQITPASAVSFDKGTGNTRFSESNFQLGEGIYVRSLQGEQDQRAYSVGVFGLLN